MAFARWFSTRGVAAAIVAGALAACAGGPSKGQEAPGQYSYSGGKLSGKEAASINKVWAAARTAVNELEFAVLEANKDAVGGRLRASRMNGVEVLVVLDYRADMLTDVSIQVGYFGDEEISRLVLERMEAQLRTGLNAAPSQDTPG
ncbi:MAG: DUF3568 family protein [Phycisphaeraceae bacterium]|nr:DUF3568 family protein [Phycisphaeraceae bacterium]